MKTSVRVPEGTSPEDVVKLKTAASQLREAISRADALGMSLGQFVDVFMECAPAGVSIELVK